MSVLETNIKVRVNTPEESKEVQELFKEMGYTRPEWAVENLNTAFIYITKDGEIICSNIGHSNKKEITIPQLRDMVVLKRNSIEDATHKIGKRRYYLTTSEFFEFINGQWVNIDEFVDGLSFDEITTTKTEYIAPINGVWRLVDNSELIEGRVEVPKGAELMTACGLAVYFWNKTNNTTWVDGEGWVACDDERLCKLESYLDDTDVSIVWQRDKDCDVKTSKQTTIEAINSFIVDSGDRFNNQIISVSSPQKVQIVLNFLSLDDYAVEGVHQCNCPTCPDKPPQVVTHIHTFDDGSVWLSDTDKSFVCGDVTKFNDFVYDKI